jgi:amino-acid N-acetyltransferase
MTGRAVRIERADAAGITSVENALDRNDLPTSDVREKPECFYLAKNDGERVGVGGLEDHGDVGLLRSVVVEEAARGQGYGTAICDALEAQAREQGIETLYLLTTTVPEFFAARGYERVDRESVPPPIAETPQFASLCPSSATCMRLSLPAAGRTG